MKINNLIKLLLAVVITVGVVTPAKADIWCSLFGLNCPPPAQSVDPAVPREVDSNKRGLASSDQVTQLVSYLNSHLNVTVQNASVPTFYGTDAPKETVKGVDYLFYHLTFSNGFTGVNAGLVIQKFQNFASNPSYVLAQIATEIGATVVSQ